MLAEPQSSIKTTWVEVGICSQRGKIKSLSEVKFGLSAKGMHERGEGAVNMDRWLRPDPHTCFGFYLECGKELLKSFQ